MDSRNPSYFYGAHQLTFSDSTVNNINGNVHNISTIVSEHKEFFTVSNLQHLRPFDQSMDGYYTAVLYNRALNSLPVVIRRFNRKEDRDRFMTLLDRYGWTPLVMKKFWTLTINGDPCLVVDSAAVYTWEEAVQGNLIEDSPLTYIKMWLQIGQLERQLQCQLAGTNSQTRKLSYDTENMDEEPRLFSMEGKIILDPEYLLGPDDLVEDEDFMKANMMFQELRMAMSKKRGTIWVDGLMSSTVYRAALMTVLGNAYRRMFSIVMPGRGYESCLVTKEVGSFKPNCSFPVLLTAVSLQFEELAREFFQERRLDELHVVLPAGVYRGSLQDKKNNDREQLPHVTVNWKALSAQTAVPFLFTESADAMNVDD
ncbi:hypothetical protein K435DRAFT_796897 [Dendrothele bispora CBS 962.96]|uniref:Uncharacterized protein n=1 Tax=Dendrothele bispora (strain CBS 962.96) TaxID=1314807 RepID=A0A4S8M458_DENBC|nr:hypothetical protein K435DRAFT_796897 [Dendrothele bispora CBS 962.96]